jgi:hypothetical protein
MSLKEKSVKEKFVKDNPESAAAAASITDSVWTDILTYVKSYVKSSTQLPTRSQIFGQLSKWGIGYDLLSKIYNFYKGDYDPSRASRRLAGSVPEGGGGYMKKSKKKHKSKRRKYKRKSKKKKKKSRRKKK